VQDLSGDLDALVTGSLDDVGVGIYARGGVEDVTAMLRQSHAVLGPVGPYIALRIEDPFMDAAIREWHT
jgi:hypothetical protein